MIIQFTETELQNLSIQREARRQLADTYLAEREQVWQVELEKAVLRNDRMWNGSIYTLEDILACGEEHILFRLSTCEFKDAVFRFHIGLEQVSTRFGPNYLFKAATVTFIPVTRDGKFVFGIRGDFADRGTHPVGTIGGGLSEDETVVNSWADICHHMLREIGEETQFVCQEEDLRFCALGYDRCIYQFCFTARLPVHSSDVKAMNNPGEFSELLAFDREEVFSTSLNISASFRFWRNHLHLITEKLDS